MAVAKEREVVACVVVVLVWLGVLGVPGVDGIIEFSIAGATADTYRQFILALRAELTRQGTTVHNISRLPREADVPDTERFVMVDLTNLQEHTITVAIDVVNVYVVGYRAGDQSFLFRDAADAAFRATGQGLLFPNTQPHNLSFGGGYPALPDRSNVHLGLTALDNAITRLWYSESQDESLLVIIQMLSEPARFRFIERQICDSIKSQQPFTPGHATLSLENNWRALSEQIQSAVTGGVFQRAVQIRNISNNPVLVDSMLSPVIRGIALLLYRCGHPSHHIVRRDINMLVEEQQCSLQDDGGSCPSLITYDPDLCPVSDPTTRISGRDGLCVDVRDGLDNNGNPVQLWPCGQQRNQQWTLGTDGMIRSMGKCLTVENNPVPGATVVIDGCTKARVVGTLWEISIDGIITDLVSELVLSAKEAKPGTTLTLENNVEAAWQAWKASDVVEATVCCITGLRDLCLEANQDNTCVWMETCVYGKDKQQWALYSEGTIRVDTDRSLCLTSDCLSEKCVIVIRKCQGSVEQRWVFKNDGLLVNPGSGLAMDVIESHASLRQIILYEPYCSPYQKWLPSL